MSSKKVQKISVGDLVGVLGRRAPFDLAEEWDNVGFLAGDPAENVTGVVVAVNLGPEALAEAEACGANTIVCHHPPIFKPILRVTRTACPYLYEALRKGISVIALHTNFDLASEDVSRKIAGKLGARVTGFLAPRGGSELPRSQRLGKFVTYVPEKNLDEVRIAICKAGAGNIGNYSQCSFSWEGEGTFSGGSGSNPSVGKSGQLERVREYRLEALFPMKKLAEVVAAARSAHPYEEMAYDILELAESRGSLGYGFCAEFAVSPMDNALVTKSHLAFPMVLDNVKETFQLQSVTVVGPGLTNPQMDVRRIGFSPGSGSSFVGAASSKGVDVYICGEIGYHQMLEARQKGLTLILLGHSYSERFFVETVAEWCEAAGVVKKVFETVHDTL